MFRGASSNAISAVCSVSDFTITNAVLRMAHLHSDMERLDIHVALEACDIVIESATIVAILDLEDKSSAAPRSGRKSE